MFSEYLRKEDIRGEKRLRILKLLIILTFELYLPNCPQLAPKYRLMHLHEMSAFKIKLTNKCTKYRVSSFWSEMVKLIKN